MISTDGLRRNGINMKAPLKHSIRNTNSFHRSFIRWKAKNKVPWPGSITRYSCAGKNSSMKPNRKNWNTVYNRIRECIPVKKTVSGTHSSSSRNLPWNGMKSSSKVWMKRTVNLGNSSRSSSAWNRVSRNWIHSWQAVKIHYKDGWKTINRDGRKISEGCVTKRFSGRLVCRPVFRTTVHPFTEFQLTWATLKDI